MRQSFLNLRHGTNPRDKIHTNVVALFCNACIAASTVIAVRALRDPLLYVTKIFDLSRISVHEKSGFAKQSLLR